MKIILKQRVGLAALYAGSVLCSILPVLLAVIFNRATYFSNPERSVAMATGGVVATILVIGQTMGRLPKNVHRLIKYGAACLCCWALRPIIEELCLLLTCAFGGEFASWAIFTLPIRNTRYRLSALNSTCLIQTMQKEQSADNGGRV